MSLYVGKKINFYSFSKIKSIKIYKFEQLKCYSAKRMENGNVFLRKEIHTHVSMLSVNVMLLGLGVSFVDASVVEI